jgi:hypothetical protein
MSDVRNIIGPCVGFGIRIDHSSGNTPSSNRATADWAGQLLYTSGRRGRRPGQAGDNERYHDRIVMPFLVQIGRESGAP